MTSTSTVTVVGDALIDELRDEKGTRSFPGGAALNVAIGLRILGIPTTLIAMIGDDEDGTIIRDYATRYGVTLLPTTGVNGSSRAISVRTAGEPRYEFNAAAQNRKIDFDQSQTEALNAATLVVVSCFPFDNNDQTAALTNAIHNPADRLLLDPNPRAGMLKDRQAFVRNFERTASNALLTKVGDDDAKLLYDTRLEELVAHLHQEGMGAILGTAGPDGAHILDARNIHASVPIAALPGSIVDTMGAGDAVLASVAQSILTAGLPQSETAWRTTLETSMIIAASTCRSEGALLRLPEHD